MQRQGNAAMLALAATRARDMLPLRRIINGRVRSMIEETMNGVDVPGSAGERKRFLEGVGGISQKIVGAQAGELITMCRRRARGLALNKQLESIRSELLHMRRIIKVAGKGGIPGDYATFLGRPDFDIDIFLHSAVLFGRGREVEFTQISDQVRKVRIEFLKELKKKNAEKVIAILRDNLSEAKDDPAVAYEIFGLLGKDLELAKALLAKAEPKRYYEMKKCHEDKDEEGAGVLFMKEADVDTRWDVLRSLTDIGIYVNPCTAELVQFNESFSVDGISGFIAKNTNDLLKREMEGVSSENELIVATRSAVQHELQHVFDNISLTDAESGPEEEGEYRAYLGELAFSEERIRLCASFMNGEDEEPEESAHYHARKRIGRLLLEKNPKNADGVISVALDLLNEAYRRICGLTYEQIIGPFGKAIEKKD